MAVDPVLQTIGTIIASGAGLIGGIATANPFLALSSVAGGIGSLATQEQQRQADEQKQKLLEQQQADYKNQMESQQFQSALGMLNGQTSPLQFLTAQQQQQDNYNKMLNQQQPAQDDTMSNIGQIAHILGSLGSLGSSATNIGKYSANTNPYFGSGTKAPAGYVGNILQH